LTGRVLTVAHCPCKSGKKKTRERRRKLLSKKELTEKGGRAMGGKKKTGKARKENKRNSFRSKTRLKVVAKEDRAEGARKKERRHRGGGETS